MSTAIRAAAEADREGVCALLTAAKLPVDGLSERLEHFVVGEEGGCIVAAAGLERYGDSVLLRSVVVAPLHQGTGLGGALAEAVLVMARELGARDVFLLTETAEMFFVRRGFKVIERTAVPPGIRNSVEFTAACPQSAVVMSRAVARA